jgi:hypothetical protein
MKILPEFGGFFFFENYETSAFVKEMMDVLKTDITYLSKVPAENS